MNTSYRQALFTTYEEISCKTPKYSLRRHYSHIPSVWRDEGHLNNQGIGSSFDVNNALSLVDSQEDYRDTDPIYDDVYEPTQCFHLLGLETNLEKSITNEVPTYIKLEEPCPSDEKEASFSNCSIIWGEKKEYTTALKCSEKRRPTTVTDVKRRHSMFPVVSVSGQNSSSYREKSRAYLSKNRSFQGTTTLTRYSYLSKESGNKEDSLSTVRYHKILPEQDLERKNEKPRNYNSNASSSPRDKISRSNTFQGTPFRMTKKLLSQRDIVHPITVRTAGTYNPFKGAAFKSSTFPRVKCTKPTTLTRIRSSIQQVFNRLKMTKSYNMVLNKTTTNGLADLLDYQGHPSSCCNSPNISPMPFPKT